MSNLKNTLVQIVRDIARDTLRVLNDVLSDLLGLDPEKAKSKSRASKMERFTKSSRYVLGLAQEHAYRLHHGHIGPEHFLLGLMLEKKGTAYRALSMFKLDFEQVKAQVDSLTDATKNVKLGIYDNLYLSEGSKRLLELSVDEARTMSVDSIGTEHLLLALVRDPDSVAVAVLRTFNVSPEEVRTEVLRILAQAHPLNPT